MRFYGDSTGSPFFANCPQAEAPEVVGHLCDECGAKFTETDSVVLSGDERFHRGSCFGKAMAEAGIV
jgi:hypothetical protein